MVLLLMLFSGVIRCIAQVPAEKAVTNSTEQYFEEALVEGALRYKLTLYSDSVASDSILSAVKSYPAFIIPNLQFGKSYWWQVQAFSKAGVVIGSGNLHRFSIRNKKSSLKHKRCGVAGQ